LSVIKVLLPLAEAETSVRDREFFVVWDEMTWIRRRTEPPLPFVSLPDPPRLPKTDGHSFVVATAQAVGLPASVGFGHIILSIEEIRPPNLIVVFHRKGYSNGRKIRTKTKPRLVTGAC